MFISVYGSYCRVRRVFLKGCDSVGQRDRVCRDGAKSATLRQLLRLRLETIKGTHDPRFVVFSRNVACCRVLKVSDLVPPSIFSPAAAVN